LPAELQGWYIAAAGIFGLVVGSFLNVCIYRIPRDLSVVLPRSFCPECGKQIPAYDNIPLLSYAVLRGKCRFCGKRIAASYPMVELATAALFSLVAYRYGWNWAALKWAIFEAMLVILFWTDLETQILPDELTLGGTGVGLIFATFVMVPDTFVPLLFPAWKPVWCSLFSAGLGVALLAGPMWLLGKLYGRIRNRDVLGLGDVKLLMLFGVFLGLESGLLALLIGAVAGSVIGLIYIAAAHKKFSEAELPFGSFLCAGAAVVPLVNRLGGRWP
jgi:leader peptidase (prepilin peptidase)/N-methyltransferase